MSGRVNFGKIVVVAFITALIWVWADLALEETYTVPITTLSVAGSADPSLWTVFDGRPSAEIRDVELSGPASKVAKVRRALNDGSLKLEFFLDPRQQDMATPGTHVLNVLGFLRRIDQIAHLGLSVKSCKPEKLDVVVRKLVPRSIPVKVIDRDQSPLKPAGIEPPQVEVLVPADMAAEAVVQLSPGEIEQARVAGVDKVPFVELAANQIRKAASTVKVTMPVEGDQSRNYTVTTATLGFTTSANLQGRYRVEVENLDAVVGAISVLATAEAKRVYESRPYQVVLEIEDSDADSTEPLRREVTYNFPPEFLEKGDISLNQSPAVARFRLLPAAAAGP